MRCRAFQPAVFDEDAVCVRDVEQSADGNGLPRSEDELAFKEEKRFPVCYLIPIPIYFQGRLPRRISMY